MLAVNFWLIHLWETVPQYADNIFNSVLGCCKLVVCRYNFQGWNLHSYEYFMSQIMSCFSYLHSHVWCSTNVISTYSWPGSDGRIFSSWGDKNGGTTIKRSKYSNSEIDNTNLVRAMILNQSIFSPPWWHLWCALDDTPGSRPHNNLHTSPAARRRGCRCAPPPSGTPAPPPQASQWSGRSCDSTLLETLSLWKRIGSWVWPNLELQPS